MQRNDLILRKLNLHLNKKMSYLFMTKKNENSLDEFNYPNDKYKKFFERFNEINSIPIENWKPIHLLSYFDKKYFEYYNLKYKYKFNSPSPSNCFEIFNIKKIGLTLSSDPKIIKNYIDWIFSFKIKEAKRKITSISFITNEEIMNFYKMNYLFNNNIERSTQLPNDIKNLCLNFKINNYGELAFLFQAFKISQNDENLKKVFSSLKDNNFDFSILDKIK